MSDENNSGEIIPLNGGSLREEIDIQIATAKKYPRNLVNFRQQATSMATYDADTAAACFYSLPRSGEGGTKMIEGPGIRLAEIVASTWGNLRVATKIIYEDEKCVIAQGIAHDLETNYAASVEVRKSILNKFGKKFSNDMITTTANAASAVALRNVIYKVVPRLYVDQIFKLAKKTAVGEASTLPSRRATVIERLNKMGATKEMILDLLGKKGIEEIGLEDLEKLIGIGTAIKEGSISVDEAFGVAQNVPNMTPQARSQASALPPPTEQTVNFQGPPVVKEAVAEPVPARVASEPKPQQQAIDPNAKISPTSIKIILEKLADSGLGAAKFNEHIKSALNAKSINELKESEVQGVLAWISKQYSMKS